MRHNKLLGCGEWEANGLLRNAVCAQMSVRVEVPLQMLIVLLDRLRAKHTRRVDSRRGRWGSLTKVTHVMATHFVALEAMQSRAAS